MSFHEQMPVLPTQESSGSGILSKAKEIYNTRKEEFKKFFPKAFDATVGLALDPVSGAEVASAVRSYVVMNARAFAPKSE